MRGQVLFLTFRSPFSTLGFVFRTWCAGRVITEAFCTLVVEGGWHSLLDFFVA